jgi:hypothetical protein
MFDLAQFFWDAPTTEQLHRKNEPTGSRRRLIKGDFVKAIPLQWLAPAAACSGKTLAVVLAVWFQLGRCRGKPVKLTSAIVRRFSVGRKASYHGLKQLERLGLITVHRQVGKNPVITVNLKG